MPSVDVFVAGGGPAGLAAAIAARQKGLEVMLADHSRPPIDKACGEGLMPDGIAALQRLGVRLDPTTGFAFRGIRFLAGGASVEAAFPFGFGLGMRRVALHRALVESAAAAGARMRWGARVEGLTPGGVRVDGETVSCRWVVGADGGQSRVRRWAGLDACTREQLRFGFRRHYHVRPWSDYMELYWGDGHQVYVTPVGAKEVCVTLISRDRRLRLESALSGIPVLRERLIQATTSERGAVSATRRLERVVRGRLALLGDASGSVDAITGEGLCLAFRQAEALAGALVAGDLSRYETAHRKLARRPAFMAALLLAMENRTRLRTQVLRTMAAWPGLFARMLALHVGALGLEGELI